MAGRSCGFAFNGVQGSTGQCSDVTISGLKNQQMEPRHCLLDSLVNVHCSVRSCQGNESDDMSSNL